MLRMYQPLAGSATVKHGVLKNCGIPEYCSTVLSHDGIVEFAFANSCCVAVCIACISACELTLGELSLMMGPEVDALATPTPIASDAFGTK